ETLTAIGALTRPSTPIAAGRARTIALPSARPTQTRKDHDTFWASSARKGPGAAAVRKPAATASISASIAMPRRIASQATFDNLWSCDPRGAGGGGGATLREAAA